MQPISPALQLNGSSIVQASVINGFALLGFADGLTVIFEATTLRQMLPYAEFVYNVPMTPDCLPEQLHVERF